MIEIEHRNIVFDFDGVILESNDVRLKGYSNLFPDYPEEKVNLFIDYCKSNAGKSRYIKIKYFFEKILKIGISEMEVADIAERFSKNINQNLLDCPFVHGAKSFLENNFKRNHFFIISSSDEKELQNICNKREIAYYFVEVMGSPENKYENFSKFFKKYKLKPEEVIFVGDTNYDIEVAKRNNLHFIGRNSGQTNWGKYKDILHVDDLNNFENIVNKIEV